MIVNSPCNPSGHVLDGGELAGLGAILEAHNSKHDRRVLLIVDEVYRRLTYAPHKRVEPFAAYEHTVLARSFSKDLGVAGERIGISSSIRRSSARRHTAVLRSRCARSGS